MERLCEPTTLVATLSSHGGAESVVIRIRARLRQATRKTARVRSSATPQDPMSRKQWL